MKHFPRETPGCYYQRPETCCWVCSVQMIFSLLRLRWELCRSTVAELAAGIIGALLIGLSLVGLGTLLRALVP